MNHLPLVLKDIHFAYGKKKILHGIDGTFFEGTFYGIAGPNGSGKSTLLKMIAGLNPCEKDQVTVFGQDAHKMKKIDLAKQIAFVPQMFSMNYAFTVKEVVMMGRYPYTGHLTSPTEKDHAIVDEVIIDTNLVDLKDRYVNALSGGELQRVIIARAIAQDTSIILLDEPISHLDIHYQYEIINLLKTLCRTHKKTIISVLHDLNVTMNHCDHILLLKDGRIVAEGEPLKVLTPSSIQNIYGITVEMIEKGSQKWMAW